MADSLNSAGKIQSTLPPSFVNCQEVLSQALVVNSSGVQGLCQCLATAVRGLSSESGCGRSSAFTLVLKGDSFYNSSHHFMQGVDQPTLRSHSSQSLNPKAEPCLHPKASDISLHTHPETVYPQIVNLPSERLPDPPCIEKYQHYDSGFLIYLWCRVLQIDLKNIII